MNLAQKKSIAALFADWWCAARQVIYLKLAVVTMDISTRFPPLIPWRIWARAWTRVAIWALEKTEDLEKPDNLVDEILNK